MTHLGDDALVLHYYGEDGLDSVAVERHLRECAPCAQAYEALSRSLNAVTPPPLVEPPDDLPALRQRLLHRASEGPSRLALTGVWLGALLYPVSVQALFNIAHWARERPAAIPLVAAAMLWACAGPLLAVCALNRTAVDRVDRASTRALVAGAVVAAVGPALFVLVSRVDATVPLNLGFGSWAAALGLAALSALVPWPRARRSNRQLLAAHRLSALLLTVFVLGHVVNQALAFISLPSYAAMRGVMRLASEQTVSYAVIVAAVALQMVSGTAMGLKRVHRGATARNLQAATGWYLAAFLLIHVFSPYLFPAALATAAATQFDMLATTRSTAQLPFLLLGVATFLFHVGIYARLAALAYLADASVRRLSYAGAVAGTMVVVAVGLSLCGIHLIG